MGNYSNGSLLDLLANFKLYRKLMEGANNLAYYKRAIVAAVKSCIL